MPTASRISTLAPSNVPMVKALFMANFTLPVPDALAVEICSEDLQRISRWLLDIKVR
jgi:hypothetical protein